MGETVSAILARNPVLLAPMAGVTEAPFRAICKRYGAGLTGTPLSTPMVAMILSNQSAAAYLPGSFQAEHNNLPADAFKRTPARGSSAGFTSPSPAKAND